MASTAKKCFTAFGITVTAEAFLAWCGNNSGVIFPYFYERYLILSVLWNAGIQKPEIEGFMRQEIKQVADDLRQYRATFGRNRASRSYMLVAGCKAAGKSTAIEEAFGGESGVLYVQSTVLPGGSVSLKEDLKETFRPVLDNFNQDLKTLLIKAKWLAGFPYIGTGKVLIVWQVHAKEGSHKFTYDQLSSIAGTIATHARQYVYDALPETAVPIVMETSNHVLGHLIPKPHAFCEIRHLGLMNYDEFIKAFEVDSGVKENRQRWIELLGGEKEYKDTLLQYCARFGGNLRELKSKYLKCSSSKENLEDILSKSYLSLIDPLKNLTPEQKEFLQNLVVAGPKGKTISVHSDWVIEDSLWKDLSSDTVRDAPAGATCMNRFAHVHYLLDGDLDRMRQYGWLPEEDKVTSA